MVNTSAVAHTPKRHFWVTDAAITNWKEKVKNFPAMDDDKLANNIDEIVSKAVRLGKVEEIVDGEEAAKLVHIGEGEDRYFALVKKSINPHNGEQAIVTIMTPAQVDKKRQQLKWSTPEFKIGGLSDTAKGKLATVTPTPITPMIVPRKATPAQGVSVPSPQRSIQSQPQEKRGVFLITYLLKSGEGSRKEFEEWATSQQVEDRLAELNTKVIPGTIHCYKEVALGLRIISE